MTFSERMKELLDQGMAASKDLALKAGAKAKDLGERGILMLEIKQLEGQAQKYLSKLGNEAYKTFVEKDQNQFARETPEVEAILAEIAKVRDAIEQKETELRDRRN
jgi:hypothetical protein